MHAALIIDDERRAHEQAMINRLCVGLMGEGVQVTRIVSADDTPEHVDDGERRVSLAMRLEAPMRVLPWSRHRRAARLIAEMEKAPPNIIYALGDKAWSLGIELGHAMDRPVLLDVWARRQVSIVPWGRRAACVAGYVAPTRAIAHKLSERVGADMVSLVPMGVAASSRREPSGVSEIDLGREPTFAIVGESRDIEAYRVMLGGLSRVVRERQGIQAIMELHGPHEHQIWRETERLGLMSSVSSLADFCHYRGLLSGCDLMLVPERFGDVRTVLLEGMSLGLATVASAETPFEMLLPGDTAAIVPHNESDEWAKVVLRVLNDVAERRRLGDAASRLARSRYRSSDQVAGLLETFDRVLRGGAISFEAASSA
jgi:glycosyltransferase involved in cell wall biosynthesis